MLILLAYLDLYFILANILSVLFSYIVRMVIRILLSFYQQVSFIVQVIGLQVPRTIEILIHFSVEHMDHAL